MKAYTNAYKNNGSKEKKGIIFFYEKLKFCDKGIIILIIRRVGC